MTDEEALTRPCPVCDAPPGEWCTAVSVAWVFSTPFIHNPRKERRED